MTILARSRSVAQPTLACSLALALLVGMGTAAWADPPSGKADPSDVPAVKWLPKAYAVPDADAGDEAAMKKYTEVLPGADIKFDMVPIKGGAFTMGSPDGEKNRKPDEGPQREVSVEPFWMGKCEVTWDEYDTWCFDLEKQRRKAGAEATDWDKIADVIARPTKPYTDMSFGMGKAGRPAACMTQYAAGMYCKWLCAKTGRYYRLPTEAEWEYACRAGTKTAYSFGDDPAKLGEYACFAGNSDEKYAKIGSKKPNPWGLHDMHGNVAEWVLDKYDANGYKTAGAKNPMVPAVDEFPRTVRGGSWQDDPEALRSAARRGSTKDWKQQDPQIPQSIWYLTDAPFIGFRVIRPLRAPTEAEAKLYEPDPQVRKDYKAAQGGKE